MNIVGKKGSNRQALTRAELLVLIGTIALVGMLVFVAMGHGKREKRGQTCRANLKQIVLGFKMTAGDSTDIFSFTRSTNIGGTKEYVKGPDAFQHFRAISNELGHVKLLICPIDTRKSAASFSVLSNQNLSYLLNLDAGETRPNTILSGDRLLSGYPRRTEGVLVPGRLGNFQWDTSMHRENSKDAEGYVALSDGSISLLSSSEVTKQLTNEHNFQNRFLFPE